MAISRRINRQRAARLQQALRELKHRYGYADYRLAKILGVSQSTMSRWMTGRKRPSPAKLKKVCRILNTQLERPVKPIELAYERLSLEALNQAYLTTRPEDPLAAWSFVPFAGAFVFNFFSCRGFVCRLETDHQYGSRIIPQRPDLENYCIRVDVTFETGLVLRWCDREFRVRGDPYPATNSALESMLRVLQNVSVV